MKTPPLLGKSLALVVFVLTTSLVALGQRTPRAGVIKPERGPLAGKEIPYGGDDEYSQVAEYTAAELEEFISGKKKPPPKSAVPRLIRAIKEKDWDFEDQLSREGVDRYAELIKWCLEDGKFDQEFRTCRHRAPFFVGIELKSGKAVKEYMADNWSSTAWLIRPGWIR